MNYNVFLLFAIIVGAQSAPHTDKSPISADEYSGPGGSDGEIPEDAKTFFSSLAELANTNADLKAALDSHSRK
jgi:hypothetical protein